MSVVGREALAKIFNSQPYKTWAAVPGNKLDAAKVASEWNGVAKPKCASAYAQGLQTLCRENPPSGTPVPPPASVVASVWRGDAVMVAGGLSNFGGPPRERAFQLGWRTVGVQLLHTSYADANIAEMPVFIAAGFTLYGWGTYGQGSDAYQDGRDAASMVKSHPSLKGWKANGEAWAEGVYAGKTQDFVRGWVDGGAPVPLGWSVLSSDTANFARSFDYPAALAVAGSDIDIQVYGASYPTYTVAAGLGMLAKAHVPVERTTMSFDLNAEGRGPFPDYRTWGGPRRVYTQGEATVQTFDSLVR